MVDEEEDCDESAAKEREGRSERDESLVGEEEREEEKKEKKKNRDKISTGRGRNGDSGLFVTI